MSNLDQESLIRDFTHLVIPAEIWLRRDISIQAKALWSEIKSLHSKSRGGCFASDEYLQEFMGLKRSRLYEVIKQLTDKKLLKVIGYLEGRTIRKAILEESGSDSQSGQVDSQSGKKDSQSGIPDCSIRDPGLPHIYIGKNDSKESIGEQAAPRPDSPSRASSPSSKKVQRALHVATTPEEHASLIKDFGESKTQQAYQRLSEWKEDTARSKWKKCDNRTIRRWVISAIEEKTSKDTSRSKIVESRHHGLQKDHSPNHPSKIKDFSNMGVK